MTTPPDGPAPPGPERATFVASGAPHRALGRMHHLHLFGILALGLAVVSGVLVLVVFLLQAPAPKHCPALFRCGGPVAKGAVHTGTIYRSSRFGFSLEYGYNSGVKTSPQGIVLNFDGNGPAQRGQVEIVGVSANGQSASTIAIAAAQQLAPSAIFEYNVPNPYIGGVPAAGEAYNIEQNGASNSQGLERLIVLAAVRGNLAIVVVDAGPYWQFSSSNSTEMGLNDHPSPADQFAALFADPVVNSVVWPGGR